MASLLASALAGVFLTTIKNDVINNPSNPLKMLLYYRIFDDIFVISPESENEQEFLKKFNTFHKNLKFTLEHEQLNRLTSFIDMI